MGLAGHQIAELRKSLGLTQVEFAQLFGVHHMTVSKWERGTPPSPYQAALMHQFNKTAAVRREHVKDELKNLLIGAGVIAALIWLLTETKK
jgi:transcriptional regulator with XRE-family HTH domain